MSVPSLRLRCRGCSYSVTVFRSPIVLRYSLPDGSIVEGGRTVGWCAHCDGVRDIEDLRDRVQIEARLAELVARRKRGFGALVQWMRGAGPAEDEWEIGRLKGELRVATLRRSGPRCLKCKSEEVVALEMDVDGTCIGFVHRCGGVLYGLPYDANATRMSFALKKIELDFEGRRRG